MTRALFAPLTLRGLTVRNRLWVPPMCQYSVEAEDGVPTDWHLSHLASFARGGAGAVIVEATGITAEGRISPKDLGLWNGTQQAAFARITTLLHGLGAAAGIQLNHAGRKASTWPGWGTDRTGSIPLDEGGWTTVGPSPIAFPGYAEPRELTTDDIAHLVADFAAAARRAVDAGFDFVEIHAAHGYLLQSFLSPLSNHRTDEHGGSLRNRSRLLLDVVRAVRDEIGDRTPVLVRLSATEWVPDGFSVEDAQQVAQWLEEAGVDLIDVSSSGNTGTAPIPVGPGYQVPLATAIKAVTDIPVAAVGLIDEPFQAEQIVALGQADVVLVGRGSLRDPHFPIRAAQALRHPEPAIPPQYARAYR